MNRSGFTLVEVLVAMVLLGFAVMGTQAVITDRLVGTVAHADERATARQLVEDRLQMVQTDPRYSALGDVYAGDEAALPNFPGYVRTTFVSRNPDHTVVTVQVVAPLGRDTVSGTTVIGVP